jgi:RND superfamily putative drug exporter
MFERLGHFVFRRRRAVLAATVLFLVVALGWGTSVFGSLVGGGFDDPDSDSFRASTLLDERLGRDDADVVVLYSSNTMTVDDPAFREAVESTLAALPTTDVAGTATFWSTSAPVFVSQDRRSTFAAVELNGADDDARDEAYARIADSFDAPGLTTQVGGLAPTFSTISETISADIARAELLSFPVLLVLLVVVFGSLVAASMPLAIGFLAVLGALTGLRVLTEFTDISIFAVNIVTLLGLGLAIDYALFVVSRFREELARDPDVQTAIVRTVATAGRTVAFSGLTVAIALSTLLIFPQVFLRSMGLGGMFAVLVAMLGALTVLPALLAVLGHRINALSVGPLKRRLARPVDLERGRWARLATSVMRRPVVWIAGIVVLLLAMGSPFLRVEFGNADATALPEGTEVRVVQEALQRDFPSGSTTPIEVAVEGAAGAPAIEQYAAQLTALPGVTAVQQRGSDDGVTGLSVLSQPRPQSSEALDLVEAGPRRAGSGRDRGARRRGERRDRRPARQPAQPRPADAPAHGGGDVRAAVPGVRLGGPAAQGQRAQPAVAVGVVRSGGLVLPGRQPRRAAEHHARPDRGDPAAAHARHRVRPVDGLRGLPAQPHQGGARPAPATPARP